MTRSFLDPWVALEDPEMMRARLRDLESPLTPAERLYLAEAWGPMKRARGRPSRSAMAVRSKAHEVAYTFARFRGQENSRKKAIHKTAKKHECHESTVEMYLAAARAIPDEKIQRVLAKRD
jgi:hypothetical protein